MSPAIKLERAINDLRAEVAASRVAQDQLLPGRAYRVAEVAAFLQLSESTIKRAGWAGFLTVTRGRVLGEDALQWFREGAKTGCNKSHTGFKQKTA